MLYDLLPKDSPDKSLSSEQIMANVFARPKEDEAFLYYPENLRKIAGMPADTLFLKVKSELQAGRRQAAIDGVIKIMKRRLKTNDVYKPSKLHKDFIDCLQYINTFSVTTRCNNDSCDHHDFPKIFQALLESDGYKRVCAHIPTMDKQIVNLQNLMVKIVRAEEAANPRPTGTITTLQRTEGFRAAMANVFSASRPSILYLVTDHYYITAREHMDAMFDFIQKSRDADVIAVYNEAKASCNCDGNHKENPLIKADKAQQEAKLKEENFFAQQKALLQ